MREWDETGCQCTGGNTNHRVVPYGSLLDMQLQRNDDQV